MTYRLYPVADDFEARIRILRADEGGRLSPPRNGIRWDFAYAERSGELELFMIWPDFVLPSGDSWASDVPLPVDQMLLARMSVLNDTLRLQVHRPRIRPGLRFHCHEGPKVVAVGEVTRITGLDRARPAGA
ncbi:hypothetical protein [Stenotrophomonas lactitubi]|uniref:hypothetical protein n=1 Tax=Stenotrophomonas lactitubi TaxID=2045214 RepID=UPI0020422BFE|nr:hypothetical protein [Stenotrophomonas lactitubi]